MTAEHKEELYYVQIENNIYKFSQSGQYHVFVFNKKRELFKYTSKPKVQYNFFLLEYEAIKLLENGCTLYDFSCDCGEIMCA